VSPAAAFSACACAQIFPRHVIECLSSDGAITVANISDMACTHPGCTILFLGDSTACGRPSSSFVGWCTLYKKDWLGCLQKKDCSHHHVKVRALSARNAAPEMGSEQCQVLVRGEFEVERQLLLRLLGGLSKESQGMAANASCPHNPTDLCC